MKRWFAVLGMVTLMVPVLLGMDGCAGMNTDGLPMTPEQYFQRYETIIQLGVQVGVINLLETNPTYAKRVKKFSQYMTNYLEGNEMVDLSTLEQVARDKIDWTKYDATERLLVEALITVVRTELENVLRSNSVEIPDAPEKVKMYGGKFLMWIGQAAATFEAQSRTVAPVLP